MHRECRERFPRHHGLAIPWCMSGSLTSGFLWTRWREKRSRHSRRMHKPPFYASGKRPMDNKMDTDALWFCCLDSSFKRVANIFSKFWSTSGTTTEIETHWNLSIQPSCFGFRMLYAGLRISIATIYFSHVPSSDIYENEYLSINSLTSVSRAVLNLRK